MPGSCFFDHDTPVPGTQRLDFPHEQEGRETLVPSKAALPGCARSEPPRITRDPQSICAADERPMRGFFWWEWLRDRRPCEVEGADAFARRARKRSPTTPRDGCSIRGWQRRSIDQRGAQARGARPDGWFAGDSLPSPDIEWGEGRAGPWICDAGDAVRRLRRRGSRSTDADTWLR